MQHESAVLKMESKKRPFDNQDNMDENLSNKKLNISGENTFHLKMLIPSVAAGAIIGKGGETIAEIQKNVGARVKMSKPNDFYPGTSERVCLITGSPDAIATIVHFLNTKIKEKPDPNAKPAIDFDNKIAAEREKQMKVIVPNSTAGMIIGKGGCYIKLLKERSGAFIQLSQKSKETTLPERVITIIGDDENNKEALSMVLEKVVEDPQSGSCLNISYSEIQGPVANFNPTGSPFAIGAGQQQFPDNFSGHNNGTNFPPQNGKDVDGFNLPLIGGGAMSLKLNFSPHMQTMDGRHITQCLSNINNSFRAKGYNDKAAEEITKAFGLLSMHGVLQVDMVPGMQNALMGPADTQMMNNMMIEGPGSHTNQVDTSGRTWHHQSGITDSLRANMGLPPPPPTPPNQGPFGPTGLIHASNSDDMRDFKRGISDYNNTMLPVNNNSFGLATAGNALGQGPPGSSDGQGKLDIEVNESLVGAVIGPGGRSIVEIQQYSGTTIQISKKGNYSPGTRNRIVTISGPQKCLNAAKYLIEQKIQEEESKRHQHNNSGGY